MSADAASYARADSDRNPLISSQYAMGQQITRSKDVLTYNRKSVGKWIAPKIGATVVSRGAKGYVVANRYI